MTHPTVVSTEVGAETIRAVAMASTEFFFVLGLLSVCGVEPPGKRQLNKKKMAISSLSTAVLITALQYGAQFAGDRLQKNR